MRQFVMGAMIGAFLMGVGVEAGSLYDNKGELRAPSGSQQQFDYFRQRQQYLDINKMRQEADRHQYDPCAKR